MMRGLTVCMAFFAALALGAGAANAAPTLDSSAGRLTVTAMAQGLDQPWALGFLPDGSVLITERDGRLKRLADGRLHPVAGVGPVVARGQGGLLDLLVPRDFGTTREVFFTLAKRQPGGTGTAVARARLAGDGHRLQGWKVIFEIAPGSAGGRHFGARLVEGRDGMLYVTVGDRGDRPSAQDLRRHNGSVIRIARDGSVPPDNPFVGQAGAEPEIYSYGHRNPQGLYFDHRSGRLYESEHGPYGGDEVNLIEPGLNYGWPIATEGVNYPGTSISPHAALDGVRAPLNHWTPSIAPSGTVIYRGEAFPDFEGDLLVSSLAGQGIFRIDLEDGRMVGETRLFHELRKRIRDIVIGEGGEMYLLTDHDPGQLLRIDAADAVKEGS